MKPHHPDCDLLTCEGCDYPPGMQGVDMPEMVMATADICPHGTSSSLCLVCKEALAAKRYSERASEWLKDQTRELREENARLKAENSRTLVQYGLTIEGLVKCNRNTESKLAASEAECAIEAKWLGVDIFGMALAHIEALEAREARLREALDDIAHCIYGGEATIQWIDRKVAAALSPVGEGMPNVGEGK